MFHNVDMLSFYFCKQEYKITMSNTRNRKSSARLITVYFTPEDGHKIQNELLDILAWFTKWNDTVKRLGNNKGSFRPVQSWKSFQSLILG